MKNITLGSTGITVPQNGFGCLPIQRDDKKTAVRLLRKAYDGGMRFFDTARAYSDSEEKVGEAFEGVREHLFIATKSQARTPDKLREEFETSLRMLRTDYIDIYQFHFVSEVYRPGDGTGLYEFMLEEKEKGRIRHIGVTTHRLQVAEDIIESGLYETLQYPLSYLSTPKELELVKMCREHGMGFIGMKGLAGGLITNSRAAFAFFSRLEDTIPIWGIQRESELDEWLSYFDAPPAMDGDIAAFIEKEKAELSGDFCRGCGYCMPCPEGIEINNCARMTLMLKRAPSGNWLSEEWQAKMKMIEKCRFCYSCHRKCPYGLDTPKLLQKNYDDYKKILAGEMSVD